MIKLLKLRDPIWQGVGVIIGFFAIIISCVVTYDVYWRSQSFSNLSITRLYSIDPLSFPGTYNKEISLLIDGKPIDSVNIALYEIKNTGDSPITPTDFAKPIRVKVTDPWRILAIGEDHSEPDDLGVVWTNITTNTSELDPLLLNPGDSIAISIMMASDKKVDLGDEDEVEMEWTGRIVNINLEIVKSNNPYGRSLYSVTVFMTSYSFLYALIMVSILFLFKISLAIDYNRLPMLSTWQQALLIIFILSSVLTFHISIARLTYSASDWQAWLSNLPVTVWIQLLLEAILLAYVSWPYLSQLARRIN